MRLILVGGDVHVGHVVVGGHSILAVDLFSWCVRDEFCLFRRRVRLTD